MAETDGKLSIQYTAQVFPVSHGCVASSWQQRPGDLSAPRPGTTTGMAGAGWIWVEAKAARKGKRKPGCLWKPFFLFPALVSAEHPARTVGFKAPGGGELCLTHGLKNAHSLRITQTL